jgi:hypothetical protein
MGSPAYVAPEVAAGERATPQSDLWSLGATLYAALEGRPPFDRGNVMATLSALANEEPAPPQNAGPLAPVLSGLLQKNPLRRLSHARAVDRLERAMSAPRAARRQATPRYRLAVVVGLIAATVASCGVGTGALIVGMMKESPGKAAADEGPPSSARRQADVPPAAAANPLVVRAISDGCRIFVAESGSLSFEYKGTMARGEERVFDKPRLTAVIYDTAACEVWVKGVKQPAGRPGVRRDLQITK